MVKQFYPSNFLNNFNSWVCMALSVIGSWVFCCTGNKWVGSTAKPPGSNTSALAPPRGVSYPPYCTHCTLMIVYHIQTLSRYICRLHNIGGLQKWGPHTSGMVFPPQFRIKYFKYKGNGSGLCARGVVSEPTHPHWNGETTWAVSLKKAHQRLFLR